MSGKPQVSSPENFSFDPRDWSGWKTRFQHYRDLSGISGEGEELQITSLRYHMGGKADEIFDSFKLTAAEKKKFETVLQAYENHFTGKKNVLYERAKFGRRNQEAGESIERFITALHTQSLHCEYGNLREELVRDRLILGVADKHLSEKLMLTENLDLKKAVSIAQQWESVRHQHREISEGDERKVERVHKGAKPRQFQKGSSSSQSKSSSSFEKCGRCGKGKNHQECPAQNTDCKQCGKRGHWAAMCRAKKVHRVEEQPEDTERPNGFLGAVKSTVSNDRQQRWTALVKVDEETIKFKLDSGADVTVIPFITYKKLRKQKNLESSPISLSGPEGSTIQSVGKFTAKLKYLNSTVIEDVYVVKGLSQPLLGLGACEDLQMVKRIARVEERHTDVEAVKEFPKLFHRLGKIDQPYKIILKEGARPFATTAPRRVPLPLMDKVKSKLEDMVQEGVISAVEEPTDWCAPMVIAAKSNGDIRLCVDLTKLNKDVERELHPMPVVEHTLGQLGGAKIFSKLDANSGFYQITLDEESMKLTTFITPFGRYMFRRLPMGITSAPEHFQKRVSQILEGVAGVVVHIDDVLVHGRSEKEHDKRLREVLARMEKAGLTLCLRKCKFGAAEVKFLGHVINAEGIRPDPDKVAAITRMSKPTNVSEVRRILGMVNFVGKFIPKLSDVLQPLNELLRDDKEFVWSPTQQAAFDKVKEILTTEPILALYDPNREIKVSSDASSYGLGAVLLQKQEDETLRPVAYASRTLTGSEKRYAQIEKEAIGITWACERFKDFIVGLHIKVETDHKPLLQILATKDLDDLSPRLQRFRMRLMRYSYDIEYTPGKQLFTADTLSRQPLPEVGDRFEEDDVMAQVNYVVAHIPASDEKLAEIVRQQQLDPVTRQLATYSEQGWPEMKTKLDMECQKYWSVKDEITVLEGLVMRGSRIVIPVSMREEMLGRIHSGHMGIVKCRARARETIWWPGISEQIAETIKRCPVCAEERIEKHEPLIPSEFPERPWQKVGMDLFKLDGKWYLVVMDYYSRYPEVTELTRLTSAAVINRCQSFFARHGVPEEVRSDCGTQFKELEESAFQKFAKEYGFIHRTSSPHYPQSNGFAESAVKTIKALIKKNRDPYKALLEYRATPLGNGYSPAELLMGRRIRTTLPMNPQKLIPTEVDLSDLREKEKGRIESQKRNYDRRHGVLEKKELKKGETVWVKDLRIWGTVEEKLDAPRSYLITTPRGKFRRNTFHLTRGFGTDPVISLEVDTGSEAGEENPEDQPEQDYVTRYGRVSRPVQRFGF